MKPFPAIHEYVLLGLLVLLLCQVNLRFGSGHPGLRSCWAGALVAKEGWLSRTSPVDNQGGSFSPVILWGCWPCCAGSTEVYGGNMCWITAAWIVIQLNYCPDFLEDLDGVGIILSIYLCFCLYERNMKDWITSTLPRIYTFSNKHRNEIKANKQMHTFCR